MRDKIVTKEEMMRLPYIIAVDFDGTIVEDAYPKIGELKDFVLQEIKDLQKVGVKIILWTSRDGKELNDAVEFCADNGMIFDAVNENLKECQEMFHNDTRKVYANEYWDDKAVGAYCNNYLGKYFSNLANNVS